MSTKTDLAKEIIDKNFPTYAKKYELFYGRTKVIKINVETDEESRLAQKPKGKYITIEADFPRIPYCNFEEEVFAIASEIKRLIPKTGSVFVVGIGNPLLTADSLGPLCTNALLCGSFFERRLFSLAPDTNGKTAMETEKLILAAVKEFSPAAVIIVDSLAAESFVHICKSIQVTDAGISPGSGLGEREKELSQKTLGVPTVAIGTPTVIRYPGEKKAFVSPNDIDVTVKRAAKLIAAAIDLAVFPEFGIDFIKDMLI